MKYEKLLKSEIEKQFKKLKTFFDLKLSGILFKNFKRFCVNEENVIENCYEFFSYAQRNWAFAADLFSGKNKKNGHTERSLISNTLFAKKIFEKLCQRYLKSAPDSFQ